MFFPTHWIVGVKMSSRFSLGRLPEFKNGSHELSPRLWIFFPHCELLAPFQAGAVKHSCLGAVSRMIPATPASDGRTNQCWFTDGGLVTPQKIPLCINSFDPVDVLGQRPRIDELPVGPVQHPGVSAFIRINQYFAHGSLEGNV